MTKYKYLTFDDRKQIEKLYAGGERVVVIASRLGVCFTTVYRELKRGYTGSCDNNARPGYRAKIAEAALQSSFRARGRKPEKSQNAQQNHTDKEEPKDHTSLTKTPRQKQQRRKS